jgi:hypothetical protein
MRETERIVTWRKNAPLAAARSCGLTTFSQSLSEPDVAKIYPTPA